MKRRFDLFEREQLAQKSHECLWTDDGKPGLAYLQNRKLSTDVIKTFKLGYVPRFVNHQLRGRIIIPLYDPSANLIALGSRSVFSNDDLLPVYWHESYEKNFYVYGIHLSKQFIRKYHFAIVCEGPFDFLQLYNHKVRNVVSLWGTNLSDVHISVIGRYCNEIVMLLDTDENRSGQKGAEKAVQAARVELSDADGYGERFSYSRNTVTPFIRRLYSVSFEENCDPDEYVRKHGIEALKQRIRRRRNEFDATHP